MLPTSEMSVRQRKACKAKLYALGWREVEIPNNWEPLNWKCNVCGASYLTTNCSHCGKCECQPGCGFLNGPE